MANHINACCYEIWTDVNGIYSCNPEITKSCKIIDEINDVLYRTIMRFAPFGLGNKAPVFCTKEINNFIYYFFKR